MTTSGHDIRGVLIQIAGARLLLPNAAIAEVMSYSDPEPIAAAPSWLLGNIRWRGWVLPLVAFSRLSAIAEEQGGLGSKMVVLKALGGDAKLPYFALLTQGFPRLVTVSQETLAIDESSPEDLPLCVHMRVAHNDNAALLPDLDMIERMIDEALKQTA